MKKHLILLLGFLVFMSVRCQHDTVNTSSKTIDASDLSQHIAILASDEFEGRFPGSEGERKTLEYLVQELKRLGLQPAFDASFLQKVPLIQMTVNPGTQFDIQGAIKEKRIKYGRDFTVWTSRNSDQHTINKVDMIFAGYGIVAPEKNWDDYAGVDVSGKIVLVLANDPGCRDGAIFGGTALSHYSRPEKKAAEARKRGAVGIFYIHEAGTAGYAWDAERYSKPRPRMQIRSKANDQQQDLMQGWIRRSVVEEVLTSSGMSLKLLIEKTHERSGFGAALGLIIMGRLNQEVKFIDSFNVGSVWPGAQNADECVVLTAHWDHLGRDTSLAGDQIYNGAADNAVGVAALLEMAEALSQSKMKLDRSILFLFPTAEERGLLGSAYYVDHPAFPMAKTLADFNVDGIFPFGPMQDVGVIGWGMSDLDAVLTDAAKEEGRTVTPDHHLEQGYFYRLDMFNFAQKGVPAHHIGTGSQPVDSVHTAQIKSTLGSFYHRPFDEYKPEIWDMRGMIQDIRLTYRMACRIAKAETFPAWESGSPFARMHQDQ